VPIGTLPYAGELKIHPAAAAADLRIAIGSILPHPFAGFGGGPKLVLPGIANFEAIRRHHLALMIAKGVVLGNCDGNPWRDEIYEAAKLAKLDFIVNALYDADEDVKAIVAGHYEKAHPLGAAMCAKEMGVSFDQTADVTISSAFPYTEGPQILKPLVAATMVTKKGGTLLMYAGGIKGGRLPESLLEAFDAAFSAASGGDTRQLVIDCLRDGRCVVPDAPMDFNSALNTVLLAQKRLKSVLVSPDADEKQVGRLGFDYASSLQEAIDMVARDRASATVNILPSGGLVLPLLAEGVRFEW
jgi:nickel-dependent lactate racemase